MPQAGIFNPDLKLSNAALRRAAAGASARGFRHAAAAGEAFFSCTGARPDGQRGLLIALDGDILNLGEAGELCRSAAAGKKPEELLADIYRAREDFPAEKLAGDFTLSIYDRLKKKLFLFRSGSGGRPLYYGFAGGSLVWASDIPPLRELFGFKTELSPGSLDLYLGLNYIPAPYTAYKGLSKLRMGEVLAGGAGMPAAARLFSLPAREAPRYLSLPAAKKTVRNKLETAVAHAAGSGPGRVFLLSGGLDSSALVAAASVSVPGRLNTVSLTFPDRACSEERFSSLVVEKFNTRHEVITVGTPAEETLWQLAASFNEPVSDDSAVPLFQAGGILAREFSGVITGTGGDELFGGHSWHPLMIKRFFDFKKEGVWAGGAGVLPPDAVVSEYARKMVRCSHFDKAALYSDGFLAALARGEDRLTLHLRDLIGRCSLKDITNMALECDMRSFLPEYLCMNAYSVFVKKNLKVLTPFLSRDVVSFVSSLPGRWKIKGRIRAMAEYGRKLEGSRAAEESVQAGQVQKYLLREAFRGVLPRQITGRGKHGLNPPCSDWLRKELKLFWYERVVLKGTLAGVFLDKRALQALYYEHQSGKADHRQEMWNLLMFELWHAQDVKGGGGVISGNGRGPG